MDLLVITTEKKAVVNPVYKTAVGDRTTLVELSALLKKHFSKYDLAIADVEILYNLTRAGDIPHSLASVDKAKKQFSYKSPFNIKVRIAEAVDELWGNV